MNVFKKLKKLLKSKSTEPQPADTPQENPVAQPSQSATLIEAILAWLDKQEWKYEHRPPTDDSTSVHHIILGFVDQEHEWTCVFRVQENNQLVTIFGVLEETLPVTHYTAALMAFAKNNMNISYGSLELDPSDGEVRTKLAFDGEFTCIDDKSLGCYLQAVAAMTELARNIISGVMADDSPSQFAGDYLEVSDEITAKVGDTKQTFFVPTQIQQ